MTLYDYMQFTDLRMDESITVYLLDLDNAKYLGSIVGIGSNDIMAIDVLRDYLDCKVVKQFIGMKKGQIIILVEKNREV